MKMKVIAMLAALSLTASAAMAQGLPRKVNNVEVLDLDGKPTKLPYWGEKNLMIFYVDPATSRTTTSRSSWRRTTVHRGTTSTASG